MANEPYCIWCNRIGHASNDTCAYAWHDRHPASTKPDVAHEHAVAIIESLQAELAKAKQSILKFGHHTASCAWSTRGGTCNCGWLDVSRAARAFQGEK